MSNTEVKDIIEHCLLWLSTSRRIRLRCEEEENYVARDMEPTCSLDYGSIYSPPPQPPTNRKHRENTCLIFLCTELGVICYTVVITNFHTL